MVDKTQSVLAINPREVDASTHDPKAVKALLGSLASVARHLAELRNSYGTGHGKSTSYQGLSELHAGLAAGAALTLVEYLWTTHLTSPEWHQITRETRMTRTRPRLNSLSLAAPFGASL